MSTTFDFDQINTSTQTVTDQNLFSTNRTMNLVQNVRDSLPPDATEDQVNSVMAGIICGEMRSRKTHEGVTNAFWAYAAVIGRMREHSPGMHDQVVLELAERLTEIG